MTKPVTIGADMLAELDRDYIEKIVAQHAAGALTSESLTSYVLELCAGSIMEGSKLAFDELAVCGQGTIRTRNLRQGICERGN